MNIIKFSYDINLKLSEHLSTTLCICSLPWLLTVSSTVCLYRFQSNPSLQPRWPPLPLLLWDLNFFWLRQWAPSTRNLFHSNMGASVNTMSAFHASDNLTDSVKQIINPYYYYQSNPPTPNCSYITSQTTPPMCLKPWYTDRLLLLRRSVPKMNLLKNIWIYSE